MPIFRVLISILCVTLLFTTQASHVLAPNPGAVCDSNFAQGSFTSADYTNLVSALSLLQIILPIPPQIILEQVLVKSP